VSITNATPMTGDLPGEEDLARQIASLFAEELNIAEIDADSHFLFLGADSLNVERVMVAIGRRFSINLATATILETPTPRALARLIASMLSSRGDRQR
jgi:acyl carrier protein